MPNLLQGENSADNVKVVVVEDTTATTGNKINVPTVQVMVDEGIKKLTGINDIGSAWKSLLPGVTNSSKIAVKVNCLFTLSTHPDVTYAVCNSMKKMLFSNVPFPENNIIIYDYSSTNLTNNGKYTINKQTRGIRCFGTDNGYSSQTYDVAGSQQKLTKIVTEMTDYLVNIAVLKNHGTSGITLCMKNHYGTCNNPGGLHGNNCDPYIGALNSLAPIKSKQKVFIIDALFGIKSGGPGGSPQFTANRIFLASDIVAIDSVGRKFLADNGCSSASYAHHIDNAATQYALGVNDLSKIDVINIKNTSAPTPSVHLLAPNGGEKLVAGTNFNITWTYENIANVKIEYSTNAGTDWQSIIATKTASSQSFQWVVPNVASNQCKIRISDVLNANTFDVSDSVFSIESSPTPTLKIIQPNGGEKWEGGKSYDISWQSANVSNIKIEYSTNNGSSWNQISASFDAKSGSYSWKIPNQPSSNCKIKISDATDSKISDESDSVFTISQQTSVNDSEEDLITAGNSFPNPFTDRTTIEYNLTRSGTLKIELLDMHGKTIDVISEGFNPTGNHKIVIQSGRITSGLYYCKFSMNGFEKSLPIICVK